MRCSAYLNHEFYIMGGAFWLQHLTTILAATSCPTGCRSQIMKHSSKKRAGDAGQSCHEPALWGGSRLSKKSSSLFATHELSLTLESDIWDAWSCQKPKSHNQKLDQDRAFSECSHQNQQKLSTGCALSTNDAVQTTQFEHMFHQKPSQTTVLSKRPM